MWRRIRAQCGECKAHNFTHIFGPAVPGWVVSCWCSVCGGLRAQGIVCEERAKSEQRSG